MWAQVIRVLKVRDAEAEAEAVPWVSRFRIRGWVIYEKNNYILVEAEAEARKRKRRKRH